MKRLISTIIFIVALSTSAFGATFYVSTTGSDSNGCTNATTDACATLTYALTKVTSGAGDKIQVRGGTYTNHKTQTVVAKSNLTIEAYPGESPIFDLETEGPCSWTPVVSTPCWDDFMFVRGCSNVTIDGLEVRNSNGGLLQIGDAGYTTSYITVQNFKGILSYGWNTSVVNASYVNVDQSEFAQGGYGIVLWGGAACRANEGWCDVGCFTFSHANNSKLSRSIVRDSGREGASTQRGDSYSNTFEYNVIYGTGDASLYLDSGDDHIARYNLIYGTTTNANGKSGTAGIGLYVNNELKASGDPNTVIEQTGVKVYGNLVANKQNNFYISTHDRTYRPVRGVECYNNSFVMPAYKVDGRNVTIEDTYAGGADGHIFKNNIVWGGGGYGIAYAITGQVSADYNLWSSLPDSDLIGAHDPSYAAPLLSKTTGWNSITEGSIDADDFALQEGSPAINAGTSTPVASPDDEFLDCSASSFLTKTFTLLSNNTYTPWDIGADVYTTEAPPAPPSAPSNFSCSSPNAQAITCTWDTVADADTYEIDYSAKSGDCATGGTEITGITALTQTVEGLTPGQQYCFYIRSRNVDGESSYTAAQTPTVDACETDWLLNHFFAQDALNGWSQNVGGTTTITMVSDEARLYDNDNTYGAQLTRNLGLIGSNWTRQIKVQFNDLPTSYSGTPPYKLMGFWANNGERSVDIRFAGSYIYYRNTSAVYQAGKSDYSDDGAEHVWRFEYSSSTTTLTVYRDDVEMFSANNAGYVTTSDGWIGISCQGVSTDIAELTVDYDLIVDGICGALTDSEPAEATGHYRINL